MRKKADDLLAEAAELRASGAVTAAEGLERLAETRSKSESSEEDMRDAAAEYAGDGHSVFPIQWRKKAPCIPSEAASRWQARSAQPEWAETGKGGFHCTAGSADVARHMWAAHPGRVGYAIPKLRVVIDSDHEGSLAALARVNPTLAASLRRVIPHTAEVSTPHGRHWYFRVPHRIEQTHSKALLRCGPDNPRHYLDIKGGAKGYTLLPPSPGGGGERPYEWVRGSLDDADLAVLPDDWVKALRVGRVVAPITPGRIQLHDGWSPPTGPVKRERLIPPKGEKYPAGARRYPILRAVAYSMRLNGARLESIRDRLLELNRAIFEDPKREDHVVQLADNTVRDVEPTRLGKALSGYVRRRKP